MPPVRRCEDEAAERLPTETGAERRGRTDDSGGEREPYGVGDGTTCARGSLAALGAAKESRQYRGERWQRNKNGKRAA